MSDGFSYHNLRLQPPPTGALLPDSDVSVDLPDGEPNPVTIDPKTKVAEVRTAEGNVVVYLDGFRNSANDNGGDTDSFYDNLASDIGSDALGQIASELLTGIQNDEDSRKEWMTSRAEGIKLLGLKLEDGKLASGADNTGVEGMSRYRDPMLLEAVIRGHANARAELLPVDGPVKIRNDDLHPDAQLDDDANALEQDMNHFLTTVDRSYYPDTSRGLWWVFFGGCSFKKVYQHPIKRRPCSETVDAVDIIVSNGAVDIESAPRVTHQFKMRRSMMRRMQILGAYRDVELSPPPMPTVNEVDEAKSRISGQSPSSNAETKDLEFEMYESYCEFDIPGLENKGVPEGLPLPYKITVEKNSRQIVEVRRNWAKEDDLCLARIPFVKFSYIDAIGFYGIGLLHCVGSTTNAVTALAREMVDTGMFANFPGGLISKLATRQNQSQFRPGPGEFSPVETGGMRIQDVVMAMPYKEPGPAMFQMTEMLVERGTKVGGTAEIMVGEGRQDAPVGTTIALIEQATKPLDAVHKGLHASQQREFELLVECIRDDPESFIKSLRRPARQWETDQLLRALDDYDLVPVADPNTSSSLQRIAKGQLVYQMAKDNPAAFNQKAVYDYVGQQCRIGSMDQFLNPPGQAPPPDPKVIAANAKAQADAMSAQADLQDSQTKAKELDFKSKTFDQQMSNDAAERQEDLKNTQLKVDNEKLIHGTKIAAQHVQHVQKIAAGVAKQRSDLLANAAAQKSDHVADQIAQRADQAHDIGSKIVDAALAPKPEAPTNGSAT